MARFYPSGGTGGADVSVVTAMVDDVAKDKVIVGPDGNPITGELELTGTAADSQVLAGQTYYNTNLHEKRTGAMANQGAWKSEGLAAGAEVAIPPGYHNGGGKVTAKDLTSQTPGDATAAQIWTGRKAWVNGQQVMGTLAIQGGSTTIPGTAAKTIVTPNKIVTGNIVVAGDPNLIPANIKKGVPIFGVMGIAEGYFPTATDLYLRGQNLAPFDTSSSSFTFQSGQLFCASSSPGLPFLNPYNLTPYNWMNFEINFNEINFGAGFRITIVGSGLTSFIDVPEQRGVKTISLNLSNINASVAWNIKFSYRSSNIYIYRIWLS